MALNHFTFNGHSTAEFGLLVTGINIYGSPARKVEKYSVPGRNGDIIVELGGYDNYIIQYEIGVIDSFKLNAEAIRNWLLSSRGYSRLTDTYDADHYRMASCYADINFVTTALNREGRATIMFDCKPQRWRVSGETSVTITSSPYTLNNPTAMPSRPLLRLYGEGDCIINGYQIVVPEADGYVDVDCESMQAYKGTVNLNDTIEVEEFPILEAGNNTITFDGITEIEITPRWWDL